MKYKKAKPCMVWAHILMPENEICYGRLYERKVDAIADKGERETVRIARVTVEDAGEGR